MGTVIIFQISYISNILNSKAHYHTSYTEIGIEKNNFSNVVSNRLSIFLCNEDIVNTFSL